MPKFSLCIEPVLTELDFYDRIKATAELGFDAIEFWDPQGRDVSKIGRLAAENKISMAICCAQSPWKNRMNLPVEKVLGNVSESIKLAKEMGCPSLIVLAGDIEGRADSQRNILTENLKRVAELAEKEGITVNIEALNSIVDHKGYYLDSSYVAFEIMKCVNSDRVKVLYDFYHMQIMEGNMIQNVKANVKYIGHFHSAGVPGRNEHFTGESDYGNILKAVDASGYTGYVGLEYWPTYDHRKSLSDVLAHLKGRVG